MTLEAELLYLKSERFYFTEIMSYRPIILGVFVSPLPSVCFSSPVRLLGMCFFIPSVCCCGYIVHHTMVSINRLVGEQGKLTIF